MKTGRSTRTRTRVLGQRTPQAREPAKPGVCLPLDEGNEMSHLLRSRRNAEQLRASIAEIESGHIVAAARANGTIVAESGERK